MALNALFAVQVDQRKHRLLDLTPLSESLSVSLLSFVVLIFSLPLSVTLILIYLLCVPTLWSWVSDFWVFSQNSLRVLFVCVCAGLDQAASPHMCV